jgi:hypothetical protein
MESAIIASAMVKRQIDWFQGLLTELTPSLPSLMSMSWSESSPAHIFKNNLACVTVLNSGNFKGENRHLRLRFYGLHEAVATETLVVKDVACDLIVSVIACKDF